MSSQSGFGVLDCSKTVQCSVLTWFNRLTVERFKAAFYPRANLRYFPKSAKKWSKVSVHTLSFPTGIVARHGRWVLRSLVMQFGDPLARPWAERQDLRLLGKMTNFSAKRRKLTQLGDGSDIRERWDAFPSTDK